MTIFRVPVQRRFSDIDVLGHVNNVVYHDYLQEARVRIIREMMNTEDVEFSHIVARQEIDHLRPLALGAASLLAGALARRRDPRADRKARALAELELALRGAPQPDAVEQALLQFVAARLGVSGAGFSRRDAVDGLARAHAPQPVVDQSDAFLRECERARYLGGTIAPDAARAVARAIDEATRATDLAPERSAA